MPEPTAPRTDEEDDQPPQRSRWWKWTRRALKFGLILSVLGMVALFAARSYFRSSGHRELAVETAKLDAEEPGWRLPELLAARQQAAPADDQNSAAVVRRVRALIPKQWSEWVKRPTQGDEEPTPLNRRRPLADLIGDDDLFATTREARDLGLTLRNYPRGHHAVDVPEIPLLLNLDESQGARQVAQLLLTDAIASAQAGDSRRALQGAHATLNTGRSVGDEPTLISTLIRFACGSLSAATAMRALALSDPKQQLPELATLQAAFLTEANEPVLLNGLRGELAIMDSMLDKLDAGKLTLDQLVGAAGQRGAGIDHRVFFYFRRAFLPADQARFRRYMHGFIAAAKRPHHEQSEAFEQVERTIKAERDVRYVFSTLMVPACERVAGASLRHRAELLCASALIACERFRLAHGRWPSSLAEVPKELLPAIPLDPYDGTPIKFAKLPDGIAVYTVGSGLTRDRAPMRLTNPLGGTELGWRLYDTDARGLPPLPPKEKPNPVADPP